MNDEWHKWHTECNPKNATILLEGCISTFPQGLYKKEAETCVFLSLPAGRGRGLYFHDFLFQCCEFYVWKCFFWLHWELSYLHPILVVDGLFAPIYLNKKTLLHTSLYTLSLALVPRVSCRWSAGDPNAACRFQGAFETKEVATKLKLLGFKEEDCQADVCVWLVVAGASFPRMSFFFSGVNVKITFIRAWKLISHPPVFVMFDGYIVSPVEVLLVEICVVCFKYLSKILTDVSFHGLWWKSSHWSQICSYYSGKKGDFKFATLVILELYCILIYIQRLSHVSQIYCRTNAYLLSFVCEYFICCLCGIPILVLLDWWFKIVNFWAEFKFTLGCLPLVFRSDHHVGNQKVTLKKLSMMMCI